MTSQDEIDRAIARNNVLPGSRLEMLTRENFYHIVGTSEEGRDGKLDKFLGEQRAVYPDSMAAPIRQREEKKQPTNLMNLTAGELERIAKGDLRIEKTG